MSTLSAIFVGVALGGGTKARSDPALNPPSEYDTLYKPDPWPSAGEILNERIDDLQDQINDLNQGLTDTLAHGG